MSAERDNKDQVRDEQADRIAQWVASAPAPHLSLWGKAMPDPHGPAGHALLAHMFDVAAVADVLLRERLPKALVERLVGIAATESDVSFLVGAVALHDLGKATPQFQSKVAEFVPPLVARGFHFSRAARETDHATLGVHLIATTLESWSLGSELAIRLARSLGAHHGAFPSDAAILPARPFGERDVGGSEWNAARANIVATIRKVIGVRDVPPALGQDATAWLLLLAGLTTFADWVGSMREIFNYRAPTFDPTEYFAHARERARTALDERVPFTSPPAAEREFQALFGFQPSPLQEEVQRLARASQVPSLTIVEAPMGEGKTEAALMAADLAESKIGTHGFFIGLPTQATANQMFERVRGFLERTKPGARSNLHLVHGEAVVSDSYRRLIQAVYDDDRASSVVAEAWFARSKRALLAPYSTGTIDQALLGVLRARHAHLRIFGLAGKTVILDEVHAYDTYTSELIERLLQWLGAVGANVVLLSATLPEKRRAALVRAYSGLALEGADAPYPRVTIASKSVVRALSIVARSASKTVRLERIDDESSALALAKGALSAGGCVGWIRNTVAAAQSAFRMACAMRAEGAIPEETRLLLLHSRFTASRRQELEKTVASWLGPSGDRTQPTLVVGTQVLEQSLDIDFDFLITDIAPTDLLLQRAGRLQRHLRPTRPSAFATPRLAVLGPISEPAAASLQLASVYEPYVMRRTLHALQLRTQIDLPADIATLVEETYSEERHDDPQLEKERHLFVDTIQRDRLNARGRELPAPNAPDDPFANFGALLDEDDPRVHASLRALTRLGDPSVDIVCLERRGASVFIWGVDTMVDLSRAPSREQSLAMLRATVSLSHRAIVNELQNAILPAGWSTDALLAWKRPVIFENGTAPVGGYQLMLDEHLGLSVVREGANHG